MRQETDRYRQTETDRPETRDKGTIATRGQRGGQNRQYRPTDR